MHDVQLARQSASLYKDKKYIKQLSGSLKTV